MINKQLKLMNQNSNNLANISDRNNFNLINNEYQFNSQPINNNINEMLNSDNNFLSKSKSSVNDELFYELVFDVASKISNSNNTSQNKIKIMKIVIKLVENILNSETNNNNSEKFRRIKISNPNIQLIFKVDSIYDFMKFLGFNEEFFNEDLTLYLKKENINIQMFQKCISYMNLLLLNFNENKESENNFYDLEKPSNNINNNISNFNDNHNFNTNNKSNSINYNNYDIKEILKSTKDVRLGKNNQKMEYGDNWNIRPSGPSKEGINFLKQTGRERYQRALTFSNINSKFNNSNWNNINNDGFGKNANIHYFNDFNQSDNSNDNFFKGNQKRSMTLEDLQFHNPTNMKNCNDQIGKQCLELTNIFRKKNNLPDLKWDDSIWRIAYTHSKNMGDKKVPFGHKGFNERIRQFPFHYSKAFENVFMCNGYSQYDIAQEGVEGWINSPGHRRNLLSDSTHCAIATYRNTNGEYYLTQMFAKK